MITDYTKAEVQHVIRVHTAMKKDYTKLYNMWQLVTNPIQKEALANRLRSKAARLEQLSEEIKQLAVNDSIMDEGLVNEIAIEDYEAVVLSVSFRNVSFQILLGIVGIAALILFIQYLIGGK